MGYLLLELVAVIVVMTTLYLEKPITKKPITQEVEVPKTTTVVLLNNGKTHNAVVVGNEKGSSNLDQIGAYVEMSDSKKAPPAPKMMSSEEIQKRFGKVLAASPAPALSYRLYFKPKAMALTKASEKTLHKAIEAMKQRSPCMVDIIGHTDTVGSAKNNIKISLRRATYVKKLIDKMEVTVQSLAVKGFGEEDLFIPTKDNRAEVKNRNVEIVIK